MVRNFFVTHETIRSMVASLYNVLLLITTKNLFDARITGCRIYSRYYYIYTINTTLIRHRFVTVSYYDLTYGLILSSIVGQNFI